jgi:hypothetical protein
LNVLDGKVIGDCMSRHLHRNSYDFWSGLTGRYRPTGLDLHLVLGNYGMHKHERVEVWIERHSRLHLRFTPTSSSCLNLVERWLRELTVKRLRRGSFDNVAALVKAIKDYITEKDQTLTSSCGWRQRTASCTSSPYM